MKLIILALFVAAATAAPLDDDNGPVELILNGVPEGQAIDLSDIVDIKVKEHVDGQVVAATNLLHPYTAAGIAEAAAVVESPQPILVADVAESEIVIPEPVVLPSPVPPIVVPEPVVLPSPVAPVVVPEPVVLPSPVAPIVVPEPVVLPSPVAPVVVPEPVVLPSPVAPVVVPEPVVMPSPVAPEVVPGPVVSPYPVAPMVVPEPVVLPPPVAPVVVPEPVVLPPPVAPVVVPEPVVLPSPVAPVVVPEVVEAAPAALPNGEIFNDGTVSVTVNTPQEAGVLSTIQSWFSLVLNYFTDGAQTSHQIV